MNNIKIEPSPQLEEIKASEKRLIDAGLLYHEASIAGNSERYRRGETSHTIHVWWARRPHTAMRSLIYATVCKNISKQTLEIMNTLSMSYRDEMIIKKARSSIVKGYSYIPKVLDMFGGGGTIPYEALNLGLDSYSIDSNELSVFIQRANFQYLHDADIDNLADILAQSGKRILKDLKDLTDPIFPKRIREDGKVTTNYLWTYSYPCGKCGAYFSLTKRYWISKKKDKNLFLKINETNKGIRFSIEKGKLIPTQKNWVGRLNIIRCPHCGYINSDITIKKARDIIAVEVVKNKSGKEFYIADQLSEELIEKIKILEQYLLKELNTSLPKSILPKWSGIVNPALYGIDTHADIFNMRQRVSCLALLKALKDEYISLSKQRGELVAKYTISILSGLVDQMVDWNCRLSTWISQNEQVGRAFCGPGVSMCWDFSETDPVANGPSNLNAKLQRIIQGAISIKKLPHKGHVELAAAQNLPFEDEIFDAIVTDPPYYDNIFYTILADNFYAWKRILLKDIEPDLFRNGNTSFERELVASTRRNGDSNKAHTNYCKNLNDAINEAARVLKKDGTMSFIYSHNSLLGWEALIKTFRHSPLIFTSIQPLSIERKQRPRSIRSEAVNTCVVFVSKKLPMVRRPTTLTSIMYSFRKIIRSGFITSLKSVGWCDEDIATGLMAYGVALISNVLYVEEIDDMSVLLRIEYEIHKEFPMFKLAKRKSL
ncbi:MAG: DUF1156 domain-containing protein [Chromatiales bacterium]|nr:DUF1156 domain-containing protein [Chromatiales bacterium]